MDPELRQTLDRFERYFERIQQDFVEMKADVGELRTDVAVLKADVSVLKSDVAELRTDVAMMKSDVAELRTDVATLKSHGSVLKSDVSVLKTGVAGLKEDNLSIRAELQLLRLEMRERFVSVDDQMRTLALRVQQFEAGTQRELAGLKEDVSQLGDRMKNVETGIVGIHSRIDTLGDDMRQRFRSVNERLGGIEKRTAA